MTTVAKGRILRNDIEHWDGITKTASRRDQTGGTITGLVVGYEVDVLASYGDGENYTLQTIKDCIRRIGSASVTLIFNPGTWTIDDDLTIGSNFVCRVPAGCVFSVSSGKTLTFSGPVIHDAQTWTSGSGTVTENGTRYLTGKLDLTGAVIQGTNAFVFEGSSDNGFETTIVITNPTADRTITLPDADVNLGSIPSLSGDNIWAGTQTNAGTVVMSSAAINMAKGADIASATTTDIGAATGNIVDVTGTTTITGFGTVQAGTARIVRFTGALILTHNATSLILPGNANITTANGDVGIFVSLGSGNWYCASYFRIASAPLAFASQAQMLAGSSNVVAATPGTTQHHQGVAKAWLKWSTAGTTIDAYYNITSVTNNGTGNETITIATDFNSTSFVPVGNGGASSNLAIVNFQIASATAVNVFITNQQDSSTALDTTAYVVMFGDQ